uniref:Uncharacterized protein n=2 Tax=unclassified Microvirus TaxID=338099 RepID=A0AAU8B4B5_9VIRU
MEAKLFGLKIDFDLVETESFYVEFLSCSDTVSYLVRKILCYYDSTPILSFSVVPVEIPHLGFSLMDPSNIDLFNYLIH